MNEMPHNNNGLVSMEDVCVTFKLGRKRRIKAVDGVSLAIREGDLFGLLGPNGAGKSTAMYCMLGLVQPNRGTVSVLGQPVFPGAPLFEEAVYLPEEPHYHPYLSVEEAVTFYASLYRRRIDTACVRRALSKVGLEDYRRLRIAKCSKGMKQKVGLAACMLFEPRLMFLDEPTRGLDPIMVRVFRDYLLQLRERGTTIIINSHVLSEVEMVCDRVAIMNRGRIIADDHLQNLVRVDGDWYNVVLQTQDAVPDFVQHAESTNLLTTGQVEEAHLEELVRYCRSHGVKLRSCNARIETLEDVFMRVVEEGHHE